MRKLHFEWAVRYWWLWPLLAAIVTYAVIMLLSIGQSIWFDEGYSILLAKRPLPELLALTGVDAHPPFYYVLLKIWGSLFLWNEFALRSLSALFTSAAVVGGFLLIRKLFSVKGALVVLPFLVIAPFVLRYGYEVRMYALALCIGVCASLVLIYAADKNSKKLWFLYAVLVALGMYTLYMLIALWVAHVIWLVVKTLKSKRNMFKQRWFFAYITAAILFLPYIATFFYQYTHSALPGIGSQLTLTKLGGTISTLFTYQPEWAVNGVVAALLVTVIGLVVYTQSGIRRSASQNDKDSLLFVYALAFVPIIVFAVLSMGSPIFINRYMAHVSLYIYLLLGVTVFLGYKYTFRVRTTLLLIVSTGLIFFGMFNVYQSGNFVFERLQKPSTAALRPTVDCNNSVIVAHDPYTYIDSIYYFDDCDVRFISATPIQKVGGYALLFDSQNRIQDLSTLHASKIYYLHWVDSSQLAKVNDKYSLSETHTFDKQVVDTYTLIEE